MKKSKHELIRGHYEPLVRPGVENHEMLDWGSRDAQVARFRVLAALLRESGPTPGAERSPTLLDVGCGLTDLQSYFVACRLLVDYVGVDITPAILRAARRNHPERALLLADIFQAPPFRARQFAVVFCSGTLNLKLGNNLAFARRALQAMLALASRLLVVNFLHERTRERYDQCFYYSPEKILAMARDIAPPDARLQILDDYLENDFTLVVERGRPFRHPKSSLIPCR